MLGYVYITKDEKKDPRNEPRKRPLLPKKCSAMKCSAGMEHLSWGSNIAVKFIKIKPTWNISFYTLFNICSPLYAVSLTQVCLYRWNLSYVERTLSATGINLGYLLMGIKWINNLNRKTLLKISFKSIGQGVADVMQRLKILLS